MSQHLRTGLVAVALLAVASLLIGWALRVEAQQAQGLLTGTILDTQGQPIAGVTVEAWSGNLRERIGQVMTQADGRFALDLEMPIPKQIFVSATRAHFGQQTSELTPEVVSLLAAGNAVVLADITLDRDITAGFWIATVVFGAMLVIIATGALHNTLAAMAGAVVILAVSYASHLGWHGSYIFGFEGALGYVDWNVIFLIMGMMIVIAVVEGTGIFQWLAFAAYRLARGRMWLLVLILMIITGIGSAFLDNVTTMLLMTPITIQIAMALGINPLALLMPEVMASNVAGVSTLVGTPTNILIGSYAGISFNGFLANLTPGVLLAMAGLVIYSELAYRRELREATGSSQALLERLAQQARITEPGNLRKAGWVGAGMLVLFVLGERVHLLPAVTALIGATALLLWIRPDVEEMIEAVDWTTLVFFMSLFIVVGAIQEVGLISLIASGIGRLVGGNLVLSMMAVAWLGAILSTVVANIPFTAAMLPVVGYLSSIVPGAHSQVLYYCLSVGSGMGGNGSLIGASANMVTAGITERAGYRMAYGYFLKKGLPALFITVGLASLWLILRFVVLGR